MGIFFFLFCSLTIIKCICCIFRIRSSRSTSSLRTTRNTISNYCFINKRFTNTNIIGFSLTFSQDCCCRFRGFYCIRVCACHISCSLCCANNITMIGLTIHYHVITTNSATRTKNRCGYTNKSICQSRTCHVLFCCKCHMSTRVNVNIFFSSHSQIVLSKDVGVIQSTKSVVAKDNL